MRTADRRTRIEPRHHWRQPERRKGWFPRRHHTSVLRILWIPLPALWRRILAPALRGR